MLKPRTAILGIHRGEGREHARQGRVIPARVLQTPFFLADRGDSHDQRASFLRDIALVAQVEVTQKDICIHIYTTLYDTVVFTMLMSALF